ncbi:hypothetical protein I7I51_01217 [Histoplasma capsulatum]|uniref:Uncharacterized protein n=1 Tax=Ajellomyces capsulatus TaxID=5037 RepID=A0A8A1MHK7_AJECA|nr:hypothetical protein I7I51_01217 [Histoplasma capsulatum]
MIVQHWPATDSPPKPWSTGGSWLGSYSQLSPTIPNSRAAVSTTRAHQCQSCTFGMRDARDAMDAAMEHQDRYRRFHSGFISFKVFVKSVYFFGQWLIRMPIR